VIESRLDFISPEEARRLEGIFESAQGKWHKKTGPITTSLNDLTRDEFVREELIPRLMAVSGRFELTAGHLFLTDKPFIVHNDAIYGSTSERDRAFLIPVEEKTGSAHPPQEHYLVLFNQFYRKGPAKFFQNETQMFSPYNEPVYDYSEIEGLDRAHKIKDSIVNNELAHLKREWLEGLSIAEMIPWIPRSMILFESQRLHCSSDFRRAGIRTKLGLSLFVRLIE
jgi:hypothetical protein